jgi:enoyl-CoA hydratase
VILAEPYSPATAVDGGFLDQVVPPAELAATARAAAAAMARLDMKAHAATKLRVLEGTLAALRAAMEADTAELVASAGA